MKFKAWVALLALAFVSPQILMAENAKGNPGANSAAASAYAKLPLSFEQSATEGRYIARNGAYTVSIGAGESYVAVRDASGAMRTLRFGFENSNKAAKAVGVEKLPGVVNYYRGKDQRDWRIGVPTFAKVRAQAVYPGVDVVYYGDNRRLEFDFVVAPKADPGVIGLTLDGTDKVSISAEGDLVAAIGGKEVLFNKPFAYQLVGGKKTTVRAEYALIDGKVRLQLGEYDTNTELVIDPTLTYSTFLGGSQADTANGLAIDTTGNAYITGQTCSNDFLGKAGFSGVSGACDAYVTKLDATGTTLIYTTFIAGAVPYPSNATASGNGIAIDASNRAYVVGTTNFMDLPLTSPNPIGRTSAYNGGDSDAFITILNPDGTLLRETYLGGSNIDQGYGIAVDPQLNVAAVGQTCSDDFPAYNSIQAMVEPCVAFVTKLDFGLHIAPPILAGASAVSPRPSSSLTDTLPCGTGTPCPPTPDATKTYYFFSTMFGGQPLPPEASWPSWRGHWAPGINVPVGAITVATPDCGSGSGDKPQVLMAETAGTSSALNWPCGSVKINAQVADGMFSATTGQCTSGACLVWVDLGDYPATIPYRTTAAYGVALDPVGDVFATGGSSTDDLTPYLNYAGYRGINYGKTGPWVLKLSRLNGNYIYATSLGTKADSAASPNAARGIAVDTSGEAFVVGTTTGGILTTPGTVSPTAIGGQDAFIAKLDIPATKVLYGTYLGGKGDDQGLAIAIDNGGQAYITGATSSTDLPVINALVDSNKNSITTLLGAQDLFIARVTPTASALTMMGYLGGASTEQGNAIAVDPSGSGNIYLAGTTQSVDFPVVPLAPPAPTIAGQSVFGGGTSDAFVAKIDGASFPNATVTPASLSFGSQNVGTSSAAKTITLQNIGNGILQIPGNGISVLGTSGNFSQTNDCGTQLTPAGGAKDKCTISVTFSPQANGTCAGATCSDILQIVNNSANSPQTVGLSGTGVVVQGTLQLSPASLDFGDLQTGSTSAAKTVTITNSSSTYPLTITSIAVTGDFKQTNNCPTSPSNLAANASCTVSVTFSPVATGAQAVSLIVTGQASNSPQSMAITGNGTSAGQSGTPDYTLTSSLPSVSVAASGGTAAFSVFAKPLNGFKETLSFTCSLPSGASCTLSPTTLVMDGTSMPSVGVTVSIAGSGGGLIRGDNRRAPRPIYASILPFCLIGALFAGKKRRYMYAVVLVLVCVMLAAVGCGGGGGGSSNVNNMTPGVYQVNIKATPATTTTLSHTMTVTLTVN